MNPLDLAEKGYYIFPICRGHKAGDGKPSWKAPLPGWAWTKNFSNDPNVIEGWIKKYPDHNWAVKCENVIVFDLDRKVEVNGVKRVLDDEEFFSHWDRIVDKFGYLQYPSVTTGSNGRHYYFKRPQGVNLLETVTKLEYSIGGVTYVSNIDIKVGNGYVVAPGSVSEYGAEYTGDLWAVDDLDELPEELVNILPKKKDRPVVPFASSPVYADANTERKLFLCRRYFEKVDPAISGSRGHSQTLRVSNAIFHGFGLSKEEGWPIFLEWNAKLAEPWTEKELEHKYNETISKPPHKPKGHLLERFSGISDDDIYTKIASDLVDSIIAGSVKELDIENEPKQEFPLEYFPPEIQNYCREVASALSVDESLPGYLALSVTSAANGYRSTFSFENFKRERALFHTMIVLYSGGGKSPTMREMFFPLVEKDKESERRRVREEAKYREAKRKKKKGDPDPEEPPFIPYQVIQGTTSEAIEKYWSDLERSIFVNEDDTSCIEEIDDSIHKKVAELKTGVLWWYDEGSALLQGMDAYKKSKSDQSVYLSLLDGSGGGALRVDRDSKRKFYDSHTVLTAGIQDDVLRKIAKDDELYFQKGFFQRINFAFPPFVEIAREKTIISDAARQAYRDKILWMYDLDYHDFQLSEEAVEVYRRFRDEFERDFNARGKFGVGRSTADSAIMSTERKSVKRVLEVALLLEVMRVSGKGLLEHEYEISKRSMEGAIKIIQYCNDEFYKVVRYCCYAEGTPEGTLEDKVTAALINAEESGLSVRDLQRKVFSKHRAREVTAFMNRMIQKRGTVRMQEIINQRGRATVRYYYSPKQDKPIELPNEEEYEEAELECVSG